MSGENLVVPMCLTGSLQRQLPEYLTQIKSVSAYDIPVHATLDGKRHAFDVNVTHSCRVADFHHAVNGDKYHVAECNTKNVIFSFAQMIAHHSRGGCALRPGDLLATGTISGPSKEEEGCLMELSKAGTRPYTMSQTANPSNNIQRTYLEDGDEVIFTCQLKHPGGLGNIGFGSCRGRILPGN